MGKNQSASNLTNIIKQDANGNITFVSGSTTLMSVSSSGAIATTGNVAGTASYASNAELLDGLDSTVFTLTSSFTAQTASFTAFSASVNTFTSSLNSFSASILTFTASQNILNGTYATTGSNTFKNPQTINSNLTVTGSITAQTLIVSTINATQSYSSGSNIFGNASSNTQTFTGSVNITGSTNLTGALSGTSATFSGNVGIKISGRSESLAVEHTTGNVSAGFFYTSGITTGQSYGLTVYAGTNSSDRSFLVSNQGGGTPYLCVRGDGNVGIGTSSPDSKLHIISDAAASTNNYALRLQNTTTVADGRVGIAFLDNSNTGSNGSGATIQVSNNGVDGTGNLLFGTLLNGTNTERMRITSAGNVGFGTATPQRQFVIANSSGDGLEISNSSGYSTLLPYNRTTSAYQNLVLGEGTSKVLIGTTSDNGFNFAVGQSKHCYLGNTMQISSDDFGGTERQTAIGAATWGGDSNPVINLASVFPRLTFTSRALSILCQIITSTTSTTSCAALVLFCRTINGTWSSSIISNININGLALSSASGSGTSVTLNFGTANYGNATFTIMNRA